MTLRVIALFLGSALVSGFTALADSPRDRIIVGFVEDAPVAEIDAIAGRFELVQIRVFKTLNARVYTVESGKTESALKQLAQEKWVEYAERDGQVSIMPIVPDSSAGKESPQSSLE